MKGLKADLSGQPPSRLLYPLIFMLGVSFLALSWIGINIAGTQKNRVIRKNFVELTTINSWKKKQILRWWEERLGNARFLSDSHYISEVLKKIENQGHTSLISDSTKSTLLQFLHHSEFRSMIIYDNNGIARMVVPEGEAVEKKHFDFFQQAKESEEIVLSDIHSHSRNHPPHMGLYIPVLDSIERKEKSFLGVLFLEIDPAKFIFPFLKEEILHHSSVESYIARVEAGRVVFLNIRHSDEKDHAHPEMTADQLPLKDGRDVKGEESLNIGRDSKGNAIRSAIDRLEPLPWLLITKIDEAEILGEIGKSRLIVAAGTGFIFLIGGLMVVLVWTRRHNLFLRRLLQADSERQALIRHFTYLVRYANDIIVITDSEGRIVEANDRMSEVLGYTLSDLMSKNLQALLTEEKESEFDSHLQRLHSEDGLIYESRLVSRKGAVIPVEVSARRIEWEGGAFIQFIIRDITEREESQRKIMNANRLYAMVSRINRSIVQIMDRQLFLEEICRIAVETGRFSLAWIGFVGNAGRILPAAHHGDDDTFRGVISAMETQPDEHCLCWRSIREGRGCISNDMQADLIDMKVKIDVPFHSMGSFPFQSEGESIGVLVIYSGQRGFFTGDEIRLLEEISESISFALRRFQEIDRRIQSEELLRASESKFRELFSHSKNAIAVYDVVNQGEDFLFSDFNKAAEQVDGISRDQLKGKSIQEIFPSVGEFGLLDAIRRAWKTGAPVTHPLSYYEDERIVGWRENYIFKLSSGQIVCIYEDLTDRMRMLGDLKHSEERFRIAFDHSPVGILLIAINGEILQVNQAFLRLIGREGEDLEGMESRDYLHAEDAKISKKNQRLMISGKKSEERCLKRFLNKSKRILWGDTTTVLFRDKSGTPLYFIEQVHDVTDRKEFEEALRESEEKYRSIVETAREGICILDEHFHILFSNNRLSEIFGIANEKLLGMRLDYFIYIEDIEKFIECIRRNREGNSQLLELRFNPGEDGQGEIHSLVSLAPMKEEGGAVRGAFAMITDISDRKKAENDLRRLNDLLEKRISQRTEQLEESNRELESFSYSVSHDLRAPLRAVDGFSRIILEDYGGRFDEEGIRLFQMIRQNMQRMSLLIDRLLDFSRMISQELYFSFINMKELSQAVYKELNASNSDPDKISFSLGDIPGIPGDIALIRQVWTNLVSNAVKFSSNRNPPVIEIGHLPGEGEVVYYIKDNGVGFNMNYAGKLFGVFQRLHGTNEYEGTGVGLALVQRIIKRHGGRVWAEAEEGNGATFYFALPKEQSGTNDE